MAPDKKIKSKNTTYGAIFTTFGWLLATQVYAFYVKNFTNYNLFYGSLSNIIILFLWFYILAYIFTLGMALNSGFYKKENN
jgi:membrane protein